MKNPSLAFSMISCVVFLLFAADAQSQARDVDDLVDARASSGESELEDRGYEHRRNLTLNNSILSYWWNDRRQACIAVTTRDGRFQSILDQPESVCEQGGGNSNSRDGGRFSAAPEVREVDNGNVAVDMGGCNVLFDRRGRVLNEGSSCSRTDVREATDAYDGFMREQGSSARDEAPRGGFSGGDDTVTCESNDNQYQFCRINVGSNGSVRLTRRLSNARCNEGDSWGYENDGVWVDKGCRAEFEVR